MLILKNKLYTIIFTGFISCITTLATAQIADSALTEKISIHAQATVITQFKPAFKAKYTGTNSLLTDAEQQTSITSTLYMAAKLWKGATLNFNPEISGGAGLSGVFGVADATNGETFRVGSTEPKVYLARLFYRQVFALKNDKIFQSSSFNQLAGNTPSNYIAVTAGKVSIADYFDNNSYSHDPRTQFICWSLMGNGAWDYPANTRGYTPSIVVEYVTPKQELRYAASLMPLSANGNDMDYNIQKASSHTLEYTRRFSLKDKPGAIRLLTFFTTTHMGNYKESVQLNPASPDVISTRKYGRTKYGFGINAEQAITKDAGIFFRASWNDGNNETWAFTEIDHSISMGLSSNGNKWNRPNDNIGMAYVRSGLSSPHRNYLQNGGKGFMLGDGQLNYRNEQLAELYYSAELKKNSLYLSGFYQFLINPGYNKDRGPVNVFSIRFHVVI